VTITPSDLLSPAAEFVAALDSLDWTEPETIDARGNAYLALYDLRAAIDHAMDFLEADLIDAMPADVLPVANGNTLRRAENRRTAWAEPESADRLRLDLRHAIVASIASDVATGELDPARARIAAAAVDAVYRAVGNFSNVLVGAQREFDVRLADYRTAVTSYSIKVDRPSL